MFLTLLSFIYFVFDINCLWTISFLKRYLFQMWYFHFCWSIAVLAFWSDLSNLLLNMFCFWHCFLSFVLFSICFVNYFLKKKYLVSHFEIFSFHILRYFHFCWSIGISFLVWSFYFIVKYVLFLTLLSLFCFVSDFNCFRIILFWRSILFQIVRYFHFCCSIGIRFLVWFLF